MRWTIPFYENSWSSEAPFEYRLRQEHSHSQPSCLSSAPFKPTVCPFSPHFPILPTNTHTVNADPILALGLQVLGALSAATAVFGVLSFTYGTFLRPGVSVGNRH